MDYTGKEPISDVLKFRLGQYDYIGTTTGDGSAFYAGDWNHPNFFQAYIFKDWESPNTWLGTVIYAFSFIIYIVIHYCNNQLQYKRICGDLLLLK